MLSPLKDYAGPWERARQNVLADIEHITAAINTRWAATFGSLNTLLVESGGTGAETFTAFGVLVGHGADPVTAVRGAGVLHLTTSADPTVSPVVEADLALTDLATANVVSTKHGFAPKSPADATKFLNGAATPDYQQVKDSDLSLSDIVTNDVSVSKHGFVPKLVNDSSKFLDSTGNWATAGGMPVVGSVQATGKRICWFQKPDAANSSNMTGVGVPNPTLTGGSGLMDNVGAWAKPTSTAGNACRCSAAAVFCRIDQLPKFVARIRTNSVITNARYLIGLNESIVGVDTDTPSTTTQRGIYVRYSTAVPDGGWVVQTVNGAGRTVSTTILSIAASTVYEITITVVSTASINVTINGVTVNVTANIPTGVNLGAEIVARDLAAVTQAIEIESVYLES